MFSACSSPPTSTPTASNEDAGQADPADVATTGDAAPQDATVEDAAPPDANAEDVSCTLECPCAVACADGIITATLAATAEDCAAQSCPAAITLACPGACADAPLDPALACDHARSVAQGTAPPALCAPMACPEPVGLGETTQDLPYGADPKQIFNLYLPDTPGDALLPVFVWIHGGGWQSGTHDNPPPGVLALRTRGVAVMSIAYRLSDTPFPTTISDVRSAIRWIYTDGAARRLDAQRIAVGGSSAGGHLVAMLGVSSEIAALDLNESLPEPRVQLVIDFFGPSELLAMDDDRVANGCPDTSLCHDCPDSPEAKLVDCAAELHTCPEAAQTASPVTYATADDPPFLVLHGAQDCTVATPQGRRMHEALLAAGVDSTLILVPSAGHDVGAVGTPESWSTIHAAIDEHLLRCERAETPPPDPNSLAPCLQTACPAEAEACAADAGCLAFEACLRECIGTAGCAAGCTATAPPASRPLHQALFDCGTPAGCY